MRTSGTERMSSKWFHLAGVKSAKLYTERDQVGKLPCRHHERLSGRSQEGFGDKTPRGMITSLFFAIEKRKTESGLQSIP